MGRSRKGALGVERERYEPKVALGTEWLSWRILKIKTITFTHSHTNTSNIIINSILNRYHTDKSFIKDDDFNTYNDNDFSASRGDDFSAYKDDDFHASRGDDFGAYKDDDFGTSKDDDFSTFKDDDFSAYRDDDFSAYRDDDFSAYKDDDFSTFKDDDFCVSRDDDFSIFKDDDFIVIYILYIENSRISIQLIIRWKNVDIMYIFVGNSGEIRGDILSDILQKFDIVNISILEILKFREFCRISIEFLIFETSDVIYNIIFTLSILNPNSS